MGTLWDRTVEKIYLGQTQFLKIAVVWCATETETSDLQYMCLPVYCFLLLYFSANGLSLKHLEIAIFNLF